MKDSQYTDRIVDMIDELVESCDTNYSQVSSKVIRNGKPISRQAFWKMVHSGSLKVSTLMEFLDAYDLKLCFKKGSKVICTEGEKEKGQKKFSAN